MSEYPEIDLKSPDRQHKYRTEDLSLHGSSIDEELKAIEERVADIISRYPEVKRENIDLSTEARPEPWEDYYNGILMFHYCTWETDEEWHERVNGLKADRDLEIENMRTLMMRYPDEAREIIETGK